MNKKIIIITGYVAAGKTTFSLELAKRLSIPCFNKDLIKVVLGEYMPDNSAEDGRRLSKVSFDILVHVMKKNMQVGNHFIIEGPFIHSKEKFKVNEGSVIKSLIEQYGYQLLTYVFVGDINILHERFKEREKQPEREPIIRVNGLFDDISFFSRVISPLSEFNIGGKVIKVDTTHYELVDFEKYITIASDFINKDS